MIKTKVHLIPLQKKHQLRKIRTGQFKMVCCDEEDDLFTITFSINGDGEDDLQDLAIIFERGNLPQVLISDPYHYNNAGSED